jgi:16S rRNA (adenine1518-N6/adenine1519-N6)-dimethyltransferase
MENNFDSADIKKLCVEYGLSPSKKYGQNYLLSSAPIEKMVLAADIKSGDTVVEIGPGFGILTFSLAKKVKKVVCFEIEQKLKKYWENIVKKNKNIEIIWGNFLTKFFSEMDNFPAGYKVVANLPYQITSHALRVLLDAKNKPDKIIVMVQNEVADRMSAKAGEMSVLSVAAQYYGSVKKIAKVGKGNFFPSPAVDSAIVAIENIQNKKNAEHFFRVVRAGFVTKRKQLWRNLANNLNISKDEVKEAVEAVCKNQQIRAQDLEIVQWEELANRLLC